MYSCTIKDDFLADFPGVWAALLRISSNLFVHSIPLPLLLNYPGLRIQKLLFFFFCFFSLKYYTTLAYSGSVSPVERMKVLGTMSKTSICVSLQYYWRHRNRAFLLPSSPFPGKWLCTISLSSIVSFLSFFLSSFSRSSKLVIFLFFRFSCSTSIYLI